MRQKEGLSRAQCSMRWWLFRRAYQGKRRPSTLTFGGDAHGGGKENGVGTYPTKGLVLGYTLSWVIPTVNHSLLHSVSSVSREKDIERTSSQHPTRVYTCSASSLSWSAAVNMDTDDARQSPRGNVNVGGLRGSVLKSPFNLVGYYAMLCASMAFNSEGQRLCGYDSQTRKV